MIVFRHADPRYPFLWESGLQPPGRWHAQGEGPVHYFADTPDGAWAELIRHEEITTPDDLDAVRRALWAVEVPESALAGVVTPDLNEPLLYGGSESYAACQTEARRLRAAGAKALIAPSAAVHPQAARGWIVDGGLRAGPSRDGLVYVLFSAGSDLVGWAVTLAGHPPRHLLDRVRHFT